MTSHELYLVINNVRSAYNVGAIFRTADGAGVKKIYLTGYTPAPFDKKKEAYPVTAQKMIAKTALGAEKYVAWEKGIKISEIIKNLKNTGFQIVALENIKNSLELKKFKPRFPCVLILGNEVKGINKKIIAQCDAIVSIPMRGRKESLNVSVAAGIAMYEILE